jgi:F420-dependent oxidoreductase-like protein
VKVGLQIASFTWPGGDAKIASTFADVGRTAEEVGFDSVWVMDHFFQLEGMIGPVDEPMLEGYSALSYLAGITERVTLGTLVTGIIYREPGFLVKTATTLDVLSGGRAWFGIGAGWFEREAKALGFMYPSMGERLARLEENLKIAKQMWAGDRGSFEGRHYQLAETINSPQTLQRPHPPIMIAGSGEKKLLKMVAQYGDACNLTMSLTPEELTHKLNVLRGHCDDLGRDYDEIERTILFVVNLNEQSPADIVEQCRTYASLGFQHVMLFVAGAHELEPLRTLGREAIPAISEL